MAATSLFQRLFGRVVNARPDEVRALILSFGYFFCLLACYYVLRPVRDAMGAAAGTTKLPWLFTATFIAMLVAAPIYGYLVARLGRRRFVPLVYHFFAANILLFWLAITFDVGAAWAGKAFFVWLSVFNLFAVSVFWSFMAALYNAEQAKRLFGFIAAGGSLGVLAGPALVVLTAERIGQVNLLLIAFVLLEAAVVFAGFVEKDSPVIEAKPEGAVAVGGNPFAGFLAIFRSPYLAGIALWVVLLSFAGTMLYFAQADLVAAASDDDEERTKMFAGIDLTVGLFTIAVQLLITGRMIKSLGVGVVAAVLPVMFLAGFLTLGAWPVLFAAVAFQTIQRVANFAFSNVARETLFTGAEREDRFKTKNIIDGVVFRGADAANGWLYPALGALGLGLSSIAFAAAPVMVFWLFLAIALGRMHAKRTASAQTDPGGTSA